MINIEASFFIAGALKAFGTTGVFMFIAGTMAVVMLAIGLMGPKTRDLALEQISHRDLDRAAERTLVAIGRYMGRCLKSP